VSAGVYNARDARNADQTKAVIGSAPRMKILRLRIKSHEVAVVPHRRWHRRSDLRSTTEPLTGGDEVVIEIASPVCPTRC
jgi:hypothetical protein